MKSYLAERAYVGLDYLVDFAASITGEGVFDDYVKAVMTYVHYLETENAILRRRVDNARSEKT